MKFDALTHKPVNARGGQDTYINYLRKRPNCPSWILCKVYQHNLGRKISEIYIFTYQPKTFLMDTQNIRLKDMIFEH